MTLRLYQGDCVKVLPMLGQYDMLFADPPDNIGLEYNNYSDHMKEGDYVEWISWLLYEAANHAPTLWWSLNAKWTLQFAEVFQEFLNSRIGWEFKPCVQTFTFGQHNKHDLGNSYRLLWRLKHKDAPLYPDQIRVDSDRQKRGDKRANPAGKVPGDVFHFPRVTGNSKQRRAWHVTQLHEGLVERCIKLSTPPGGSVIDPFAGTGTTLRVCKRIGGSCDSIEMDSLYFENIAADLGLRKLEPGIWGDMI